jgi:TPR repeat protein
VPKATQGKLVMKLEELIKIFETSILSSGLQFSTKSRDVAARDETIKNIVKQLIKAVTSNNEEKQNLNFTNRRHTDDFGHHRLDIVSEANHALCFNEAFIRVLLELDLTNCPGFILTFAAQYLSHYGENHELRKAFLVKLLSYYNSLTLTPLQRLYAYHAILSFSIKADDTTEFPDLTVAKIHEDIEQMLERLLNASVDISNETKLIGRYVFALAKVKIKTNNESQRKQIDAEAVKFLKYNGEKAGHKPSKFHLAWMHEQGRTNIPQESANQEAVRLYREISDAETTVVGTRVNLALLHHKHLTGDDKTADDTQKIELCQKAARLGFLPALNNLAAFFMQKPLVFEADGSLGRYHKYAEELFTLAIARGYPNAEKGLAALKKKIEAATPALQSNISSTAKILVTTQTSTAVTSTTQTTSNAVSTTVNLPASSASTSVLAKRAADQVTESSDSRGDDPDEESIDLHLPKSKKTN